MYRMNYVFHTIDDNARSHWCEHCFVMCCKFRIWQIGSCHKRNFLWHTLVRYFFSTWTTINPTIQNIEIVPRLLSVMHLVIVVTPGLDSKASSFLHHCLCDRMQRRRQNTAAHFSARTSVNISHWYYSCARWMWNTVSSSIKNQQFFHARAFAH